MVWWLLAEAGPEAWRLVVALHARSHKRRLDFSASRVISRALRSRQFTGRVAVDILLLLMVWLVEH